MNECKSSYCTEQARQARAPNQSQKNGGIC
jgi:hypothetical protein